MIIISCILGEYTGSSRCTISAANDLPCRMDSASEIIISGYGMKTSLILTWFIKKIHNPVTHEICKYSQTSNDRCNFCPKICDSKYFERLAHNQNKWKPNLQTIWILESE